MHLVFLSRIVLQPSMLQACLSCTTPAQHTPGLLVMHHAFMCTTPAYHAPCLRSMHQACTSCATPTYHTPRLPIMHQACPAYATLAYHAQVCSPSFTTPAQYSPRLFIMHEACSAYHQPAQHIISLPCLSVMYNTCMYTSYVHHLSLHATCRTILGNWSLAF